MVVRLALLLTLAIGFSAVAAAEDTPAPPPKSATEAEKELAELERAREILKELKERHEAGEISDAELRKRSEKIRALYLGEGELPDSACAKVTCSFRGNCYAGDGEEPICYCDDGYLREPEGGADCVPIRECEPGYFSERGDGSDCEVDIGWAREAAITGIASASLLSVTGGFTAYIRANGAGGFIFVDLGLLAVAAPLVGGGAHSARKLPGVDGDPLALGFGVGLYSLSMVAGVLDFFMIDKESVLRPAAPWITMAWSTIGATSLLLFSLDALTAHEQAQALREGATSADGDRTPRIWTWIAIGNAGASAIAAAIFGALAAKNRGEIDDACPEDLWNDADDPCPGGDGEAFDGHKILTGWHVFLIELAVVSAAVGTTLYFLEPRLGSGSAVENVSVVPWAVPGGAGLALGGEF
jgi:hypothetical protein